MLGRLTCCLLTNNNDTIQQKQKANAEGEEVGIEPRHDVTFCSFQMPNMDEEDDEDRYDAKGIIFLPKGVILAHDTVYHTPFQQ